MLKQVLGVNRYTSNLAVRLECCRSSIILFCISMMYKYFIRIRDMLNNRILHGTLITDQELFKDKSKSWFSNLARINKLLNIDNKEPIVYTSFVQLLKDYFVNQTECQLNKIRNDVTDSKLVLFSNVLDMKGIPNYLKLFSDRALTREILKFRMSAHYLNIERGRYTKPKIQEIIVFAPTTLQEKQKLISLRNVEDTIHHGISYLNLSISTLHAHQYSFVY